MTTRTESFDETGPSKIHLPKAPADLQSTVEAGNPIAWSEPLTIRTYEPDLPSQYPMFLDHRVYQGSSGKVYPIPFTERISDEPRARQWQAVHLENSYLRLVILPELGGRIHIAYDKTTDYDFFYRNNVIKPALVGLAGPWISGGVEFNWPQHHRPATYLPVETSIEYGEDGCVTVWCADHDPFTRMAAQHGVRLRPNSSVVEVAVRLHNRTSERQTFLWWANVAARVNDDYQSFFPEDVQYVADHARRALTAFPRADRSYYGVDYAALARESPHSTPSVDRIDFYRNIPVPTSYMIVDSADDFFGGYDHHARAGFVHWAERRLSPGKKQWTWGDAPFGHAWDRQLTDDDGPYVELMAGVYTDNQPDFSWLLPGETKTFTQYWYPLPALGPAHQATPDAAVHVDRSSGVHAVFAVTSPQARARMRIRRDGVPVVEKTVDLHPGATADIIWDGEVDDSIEAEILDANGQILVRWTPPVTRNDEPWMADEPPQPELIETVEELYLTGLHLSQFRHPTRSPLPYWNAALKIDAGDARTNLALADIDYRAGNYPAAWRRIQAALARLTRRNANPTDTEVYYLAGLVLNRMGRTSDAEAAFGKAGWDGTWAAPAGFELASSLARRGRNRAALRVLETLDGVAGYDGRRCALRAVLLRRRGRATDADAVLRDARAVEPLNPTLRHLAGESSTLADPALLLDIAVDLLSVGEREDARSVLARVASLPVDPSGNVIPVARYLAAAILDEQGDTDAAIAERAAARASILTWAFPYGLAALEALRLAVAADETDGVARYLLGTLLYGHGLRKEALAMWKESLSLGMRDPILLRNIAIASYAVLGDDEYAWSLYEEATHRAPDDARLLYEHDQLAARLGHTESSRLAHLDDRRTVVLTRDDLTIEYIGLLIAGGRADEARGILLNRHFHPWEGGEGRALAAWDAANEALGIAQMDPPATLGEARPQYVAPAAVREDGITDYFATSLPELLLFPREG